MPSPDTLTQLARVAERMERDATQRDALIVQARAEGHLPAVIAPAARIKRSRVHQIIRAAREHTEGDTAR